MSQHILKNQHLTVILEEHGAELTSIMDNTTGIHYLWNADPAYWKRHAPVLFPFVGSLQNKSYIYQDRLYPSLQHGFARDMDFQVISNTDHEIWFSLEANEDTRRIYPFEFRLELGYRLECRKLTCSWRVINQGASVMYFSIGGHPAFNCPPDNGENQSAYYISFDTKDPIRYYLIDQNGLVEKDMSRDNILLTEQGIMPIHRHLFDHDALIIENHQSHRVSLLTPDKSPYLTVSFDAPLFGLWSPAKKNAPFVCIEPWYGRCDASDFHGTLEEREYGNILGAGESFEAAYSIEIQ